MNSIVLRYYDLSPFSEKIRRILAFKKIRLRSVETPIRLPKTELTALTGASRRAPVVQIGAAIYRDPTRSSATSRCMTHERVTKSHGTRNDRDASCKRSGAIDGTAVQ